MTGEFDNIKYELFDVPSMSAKYTERLEYLQRFSNISPKIEVPKVTKCEGKDHLLKMLEGEVMS